MSEIRSWSIRGQSICHFLSSKGQMSQMFQICYHLLWYLPVVEQGVGLGSWWGDDRLSQSLAQYPSLYWALGASAFSLWPWTVLLLASAHGHRQPLLQWTLTNHSRPWSSLLFPPETPGNPSLSHHLKNDPISDSIYQIKVLGEWTCLSDCVGSKLLVSRLAEVSSWGQYEAITWSWVS